MSFTSHSLMLRAATASNGRVLACAWRSSAMQLRTRSGGAAAPTAGALQGATKADKTRIKREIKAEAVVDSVPSRRSTRHSIKRDGVIKSEPLSNEDDEGKPAANKKRRLRVVIKRGADGRPEHWEEVLSGIQEMRASQVADVDVAGVETMFDNDQYEPHIARFHVLVSAMLSSQTKDPVNAAATKRLLARGLTVQDMLGIDEQELATLIRPVGFFNNKARYIKQVAQLLTDKATETGADVVDIPSTFEELVALPGVGPKMAHLVMSCAWDNTVGICVDTHVHRISNRLGWVMTWNKKNPKAQDPEKTRKELEDWLPREHWNPINVTLVGFGQTVCLPRGPKCGECKVSHLCPSAFSSAI